MTPPDDVIWTMHTLSKLSAAQIAESFGVPRRRIDQRLVELRALHGQHQTQIRARARSKRSRAEWQELLERMIDGAEEDLKHAKLQARASDNARDTVAVIKVQIDLANVARDMTGIAREANDVQPDRPDLLERFRSATASAEQQVH